MRLIKKLMSAVMVVMLMVGLFATLPSLAAGAQTVGVTVSLDKTSVSAGESVTLTFSFDQAVEDVTSFTFYVDYDENLFTYNTGESDYQSYIPENQNPYTTSYQQQTPKTNVAKFGFMHASMLESAFDGNDDYAQGVFYKMVFTAKADIESEETAVFNFNSASTKMLTYSLNDHTLSNEVVLTINGVEAGKGGQANSASVVIKKPVWDGETIDISWYVKDPYIIKTPAQLAGLAAIVNGTAVDSEGNTIKDSFLGKTITLGADIDLNNQNWTPIGRRTGSGEYDVFAGTFDGKGHSVTNLSIEYDISNQTNAGCVGLFGYVQGTAENRAKVENLTLSGNVAIVSKSSTTPTSAMGFAGLAGCADYADFIQCITDVDITDNSSTNSQTSGVYVECIGGIIGSGKVVKIIKCANTGDISGGADARYAGGIIGQVPSVVGEDFTIYMEDCYNRGNIFLSDEGSFGIVGGLGGQVYFNSNSPNSVLRNCYNTGNVSGPSKAGALIGTLSGTNGTVENIYYRSGSSKKAAGNAPAKISKLLISKTDDEMKAGCFVNLINSNEAWKQGSTYPILSCQPDETPGTAHCLTKVEGTPATCAAEGKIDYWKCSVCEQFFSDEDGNTEISEADTVIPKTNEHTAGDPAKENEILATCTEPGSYVEVVKCTVCDTEISRETKTTEALGHDWSEWTVTKEATETEEGEKTHTCSRCTLTETETIPVLPHVHNMTKTEAVAATCTTEGNIEYYTCSGCHNYYRDENGEEQIGEADTVIAKLPHTPAAAVQENVVDATCTEAGSYEEVVYCDVCDAEISRTEKTVDAPGHTPAAAVKENVVDATCTEAGSYEEVVYCDVCDAEISRTGKTVDALGHTWGEWEVSMDSTCTATGTEIRTCSACGETETREIALKDHTWDEGEVITPATTDSKGEMLYTCTVCGETKQEEIPEIDYVFTNSEKDFQFEEGSEKLVLTVKRTVDDGKTYEHFIGVAMDGKEVAKDNYTAEPGSVVITFKADYVKTLTPGEHKVTVLFDDDTVEHKLTVAEKKDETSSDTAPKTGDTNNTSTWIIIMAVAFALLVGGGVFAIRKKVK